MSSWKVELTHANGTQAIIALMDAPLWLNKWKELTQGAFIPSSGDFLNQTGNVADNAQPSWILRDLDIDKVKVGSKGTGTVENNDGSFLAGSVDWEITAPYEDAD